MADDRHDVIPKFALRIDPSEGVNAPLPGFEYKPNIRTMRDVKLELTEIQRIYESTTGQEHLDARNVYLRLARELESLEPGSSETLSTIYNENGEPEQFNITDDEAAEIDPTASPTLDELYAYFAQHPIPTNVNGRVETLDPASLSPEKLQEIYALWESVEETSGADDPWMTVDDLNAMPMTPDHLAAMQMMADERERVRTQKAADRSALISIKQAQREKERKDAAEQRQADKQQSLSLREQQKRQNAAEKLAAQQQAAQQRRQKMINDTMLRATLTASQASVKIGSLPQPGGIGLLLLTILFIVFALVPMNASGDTRIQLIWLAIRGKVALPTSGKTSLNAGDMSASGSLASVVGNAVSSAAHVATGALSGRNVIADASPAAETGLSASRVEAVATIGLQSTNLPVTVNGSGITVSLPFASLLGG